MSNLMLILICIIILFIVIFYKKSEGFGRIWDYGNRYGNRYGHRYYPHYYPMYASSNSTYSPYPPYLNDYYYTPCYQTVFGYTLCDY